MTMPTALLEDAARYAVSPRPTLPFSPALLSLLVHSLLDQRVELSVALLRAYPEFRPAPHTRAPVEVAR